MMLSSILDIGSFFIGMIINLLLVTLMCYYFKKKYESLEEAQNEQAKLLYDLLRERTQIRQETHVKPEVSEIEESDDDSVDSVESEMEEIGMNQETDVKVITLDIPEKTDTIEPFTVDSVTVENVTMENIEEIVESEPELIIEENEDEFSKMNMKQLRDLVTKKGVKVKPSMKKNELVELAKL